MRLPRWFVTTFPTTTRTLRRPQVWRTRPRGWVARLLDARPTVAARAVHDTWGESDAADLTGAEYAAVQLADYVTSIGAAHWDHAIAHPIRKRS